jgi:hypothetical protein
MRLSHLIRTVTFVATTLVLAACGDDASDMAIAIIDGTPPLLTTDSNFTDGYSTTADLFVSGQVQDSNGVKSLTYKLNEESAHTLEVDTEGHFKDRILLALGSNTILLEATDNAGNIMRSTKTIYVENTYLESTYLEVTT